MNQGKDKQARWKLEGGVYIVPKIQAELETPFPTFPYNLYPLYVTLRMSDIQVSVISTTAIT